MDPVAETHGLFPILMVAAVALAAALLVAFYVPYFHPGASGAGKTISGADRRILLAPPPPGGEEAYAALVAKDAVATSTLTIGARCAMDPLVLRFATQEVLTIKNEDSAPHVISFEDNQFFSVAPQRARQINIGATFGTKPGIYRYRCGDAQSATTSGVMYIVE